MSFSKSIRGQRSDCRHLATTRQLTRILTILAEERVPRNAKWITENCCMHASKVPDALNWLVCNRLIFKHKLNRQNGIWVYSINPAFTEMRGVKV